MREHRPDWFDEQRARTTSEEQEVRRLAEVGVPASAIAERFGVLPQTVQRCLRGRT